ncbi:hypothetical protein [Spiroplasma ixodetis]|uniref:hypothetical protein n=1 Tax=Spiroplasma ixodetis TaxID=2141 RepID=UPI0025789AD8|nr:hypothetical protein [Spiroplasma ixodetis]
MYKIKPGIVHNKGIINIDYKIKTININILPAFNIFFSPSLIFIIKNRTSPHMYLWRKQWNWMSSTMLFKQNRIV